MTMERNNSPSYGNNRPKNQVKTKTIKSTCYFSSITTPARSKHRKLEVQDNATSQDKRTKSSDVPIPHCPNNFTRRQGSPKLKQSPSKEGSPRTSPTLGVFYAGAKFSEPPPPAALPKPPMHWASRIYTGSGSFPMIPAERADTSRDISNQLKVLLNVSA